VVLVQRNRVVADHAAVAAAAAEPVLVAQASLEVSALAERAASVAQAEQAVQVALLRTQPVIAMSKAAAAVAVATVVLLPMALAVLPAEEPVVQAVQAQEPKSADADNSDTPIPLILLL
jgi:hypothetical protein